MDYSELSHELRKKINKEDKKKGGIYFTPPDTIQKNISLLEPFFKNIKNVLEPSCGSCEYIYALNNKYPEVKITGIEFNKTIFDSLTNITCDNIELINSDFLKLYPNNEPKFDLIIGNPPYFVVKKEDVISDYYNFFDGRPNIFILFIIKSLKLLAEKGILSFILPVNFLNCLYYNKTREYISKNFKILNIEYCYDNYIDTKQETIIMIIQNNKNNKSNKHFTLEINNYTIFGCKNTISKIKGLYKNSTTLNQLGFTVNVGSIVWNQCKNILTDDSSKTLLIYSSDIKSNKLALQKYSNPDKKNYINKVGKKEPVILINRGYGVGDYNFNYLLVEGGFEYLIENHLISIKLNNSESYSNDSLIQKYNNIIMSLKNDKTKKFIEMYFGNNAINTTELCNILPIYNH